MQTRFSTRPSSRGGGEGVVRSPSHDEQSPPSLGCPSQGLLHLCLPPGLAGAWTGWVSFLRQAPQCYLVKSCCGCMGAGAAKKVQGPSQHAVHVEPPGPGCDHHRAGVSRLWPVGSAVMRWRGGQKPPTHRLYNYCQLDLPNTNRSVRGDTSHPTEW